MAPTPLAARVVEVIADRGESAHPRYRYGSGCIVVGVTVLTAAHVVAGARTVQVRDPDKALRPTTVDPRFVGDADGPGPDLALIKIEDPRVAVASIGLAVVDRGSVDAEPVERCHAIGYPWFAKRPSPTAMRDTADAYGHIPVLSKLATGLLSLHVSGPPRPLPPESESLGESEWSGMSGAPVVSAGRLLGVVTEHAPREGPSTITVTPLSALDFHPEHPGWGPGVADPSEWWVQLGVTGISDLTRLPPPRARPRAAYHENIRTIQDRAARLTGREREKTEIAAFASGSKGYRLLTGGAWAGKTALLAAVVAALPDRVDVVAYFLSRLNADADSSRFLGAVVPQLAELLDEDPPSVDSHHFHALWRRASEAATATGRHVLLLVDGLDEDLRPAGSPSVAALLPTLAGGHSHVLVSSRPHPELPFDIPVGHPLLATPHTPLKPFEGSAELAALARQEIEHLKRRDDHGLAGDVLAVLTAAAGPLAVEDIAALTSDSTSFTPAHARRVRRIVAEDAARSLEPVGAGTNRRYQFAHASLLEYAQADQDLGDLAYRDRIHRWADQWRGAGWPAGEGRADITPRYLLEAYPATLSRAVGGPIRAEDRQRLADLVSDIAWVDSAIAKVGIDSTLASLRTASQLTPAETSASVMLQLLQLQADNLHGGPVNQTGYTATALAREALRLGVDGVVRAASDRLSRLPVPQLIPIWTTEGANRQLVSVLGHHNAHVVAVGVTPDGLVVAGDNGGTVLVWDPAEPGDSGLEVGRHDHPGACPLAVTGDGLVVSGDPDGRVWLWDPATPGDGGRQVGRHPDGAVRALAVTTNGLIVTGGDDGVVRLWEPATSGDIGREIGHHDDGAVWALAVTPDGLIVTGGDDGVVRLWDPTSSGDAGRELGRQDDIVFAVAVTPDGRIVSGGHLGAISVWEPALPERPGRELGRHDHGPVWALAATADGLVVSGDHDGIIRLWDLAVTGDPGREIGRHDSPVRALAITAGGLVVSGGADRTVRLWDPAAPSDVDRDLNRPYRRVTAVAMTDAGLVICGGDDGTLRFYDPGEPNHPGRELARNRDGSVSALAVTVEGLVICGGDDGTLRLYDLREPDHPCRELGRHGDGPVTALAVTADGLLVSGSYDGTIRLWNPASPGGANQELGSHGFGPVTALAVTADGLVVFGSDDGAVRLWDPIAPGERCRELGRHELARRELGRHNHYVYAVAVTGGGLVVSGGGDGTVRLWNPTAPIDVGRVLGHHDFGDVKAVAVTAGVVISAGYTGTLWLWDPARPGESGRQLVRHYGYDGVEALAANASAHIAVLTPRGVTVYKMTSSQS